MSNTAFGVAQTSAGVGTTDTDMRKIIAAQWESTGVIDGLSVTGTTSLYYTVAAGVAVCSKGASDGKTLAYFAGGSTPTVSANSSGNPRIDCIWITSHDATQGDSDNLVTIGVTQGTASATPTAPTIPTYATLLAQMVMPAGATTTANVNLAAPIGYAIPYGASLGVLVHQVSTQNDIGASAWTTVCSGSLTVPIPRIVRIDMITSAQGVVPNVGTPTDGTMHVRLVIDGVAVMTWERQLRAAVTVETMPCVLTLPAGYHTLLLQCEDGVTGWKAYYGASNGMQWPGQVLIATDEGIG